MPATRAMTLVLVVGLAACAGPSAGLPSGSPAGRATASPIASPGSPSGPAATSRPAGSGSATPGSPAASPSGGGSSLSHPPGARLAGVAGGPIDGVLGSWTFERSGSDSPWLPASALSENRAGSGARLEVLFAGNEPIGAWSARVAAAADSSGEQASGLGGREADDPPLDRVALDPLERGRWVLSVWMRLADGRGEATYYWLVGVN